MAKQVIDLGVTDNPATGDTLNEGGDKINDNFDELYAADVVQDTAIALNTAKISYTDAAAVALNTAKISLDTDSVVEAKLAPQYKGSSAISAVDVDWEVSQIYTKTITGNTVFTYSNLFIGVKDKEITGNFTVGFPTGFEVLGDAYDGTVLNLIEVICTNPSTPTGWIFIKNGT